MYKKNTYCKNSKQKICEIIEELPEAIIEGEFNRFLNEVEKGSEWYE